MKRISGYYKRLRVSFIRSALLAVILAMLGLPQYEGFQKDGNNYFAVKLNGTEIGYAGKSTDIDALLRNARKSIAKDSKSQDGNYELVYADAELSLEGREVLFGVVDSDRVLYDNMQTVLLKSVQQTLVHAYTMKVKEYTVNLEDSNAVQTVLQADLSQHEENEQYTAQLVMDPTRELNALTATVHDNAEEEKEDYPAFLHAGIDGYFEDMFSTMEPASQKQSFKDIEYGLTDLTFGDSVEIVESYLMPNQIMSTEAAVKQVTTVQDKNAIYEVQSGDTLSQIAEKTNVPMDKIISLNDAIDSETATIRAGQEITITMPEPPLSVEWEEQKYYEEDYDADIIYIDNDSWYTTEEVTRQEPSAGHRKVAAVISYRNDKETGREIIKEEVTMEAVPKIVEKGTKIPPTYIKPISGGRLSSGFGGRKAPTRGASTYHKGVDWSVPKGTTVVASSGGAVTKAGWGSGYGYVIYIQHPDGRETRYGHLSKVLVSAGQTVKQGQKIALSGNTGRSTGPHLHFEIRINGTAVNPLKYLN